MMLKAYLRRCVFIGLAIASLSWLLFLFFGQFAIDLVLGSVYLEVFYPTLIYLAAVAISVVTFAYHPSMLAMGKAKEAFRILIIATLVYFIVLPPLISSAGLSGAAWAYLIFYGAWLLLMQSRIRKNLQHMEHSNS